MTELQALPVYSGYFGSTTAPARSRRQPVKGVRLGDLLAEVGGMTDRNSCDVLASTATA